VGIGGEFKTASVMSRQRGEAAGEEEPVLDAEFRDGASNQNCKSKQYFLIFLGYV